MSWGRLHHPSDQFKVGDHLQVKVLKLDREKEKVSLGYKQLLPDPWSTVVEVYPVNTKVKGTVSSVTDYGVFVELEPGVEGLVHVSEVSWSRRAPSPKRMFHKGQEVEVQVLGVDTVEKRISLGMKQFLENPWDRVHERYPIGSRVHGRIRNLTDFGAFVELEEGIDGLVHVSDISWAKKIKHPKDVLKKDQEVDAIVTSIDRNGQRLSLSMKDLTPSAWEGFVATHRPGDVVRGKVSRFTNFGVFVELGEGLVGLCHISELSDERVERPEDVAQLGQEMDFKILRIEPSEQKIGLSHRSIGKGGETPVESRMYSSEAKGGMASLGELANLKLGGAAEAPAAEDPEERKRQKKAAKKAKAEEFAAREAEAQKAAESPSEETAAEPEAETAPEATAAEAAAEAPAQKEAAPEAPKAETTPETAADNAEAPAGEAVTEEQPSGSDAVAADAATASEENADSPSAEATEPEASAEATETTGEASAETGVEGQTEAADQGAADAVSEGSASAEEPAAQAPAEDLSTEGTAGASDVTAEAADIEPSSQADGDASSEAPTEGTETRSAGE
jgi:predicted RNA-binding protein with RPS1 domain